MNFISFYKKILFLIFFITPNLSCDNIKITLIVELQSNSIDTFFLNEDRNVGVKLNIYHECIELPVNLEILCNAEFFQEMISEQPGLPLAYKDVTEYFTKNYVKQEIRNRYVFYLGKSFNNFQTLYFEFLDKQRKIDDEKVNNQSKCNCVIL